MRSFRSGAEPEFVASRLTVMRTCLDKWREPIVIDECGREYTGAEFAEIAKKAAAIWELDSVGTWFS
jgi:hypothetical protein